MDLQEIEKLAKLSRISLTEAEKKNFQKDLEEILGYVGEIQEVAAEEPAHMAGELRNIMREDEAYTTQLASPEELLREAPEREDGYVKVDQVL